MDENPRPPSRECWQPANKKVTKREEAFGLDENDDVNLAVSLKALTFTDSVSMHGIRYIFMRDINLIRRLIWLSVVIGGMSYCAYIIYQSLNSFLEYPSNFKTTREFERKLDFPAITICSFNAFQRSKITYEQYVLLEEVYSDFYSDEFYASAYSFNISDYDDLDIREFSVNASYDINSTSLCKYRGKTCNETLFTKVITDIGTCTIFDPSASNNESFWYQTVGGRSGGFQIGLITYPEEFTYGPNYRYSGFSIAVHAPGTKVFTMKNQGIGILPGLSASVIIDKKESSLLEPPYGKCGSRNLDFFDKYTYANCLLECETKHTVEICGCRYPYMPGTENDSYCNFGELYNCDDYLVYGYDDQLFDASKCDCVPDCKLTTYSISVTNTAPSVNYAESVTTRYGLDIAGRGSEVRVYYRSLESTKVVQEAVYNIEKLICDIGGAAGLFLGCSFATIVEFVDFLFSMCWLFRCKCQPYNPATEVKPYS